MEMIHTAAQDAAQTVSRLREFYRLRGRTGLRQQLDVNVIVEEVVQLTALARAGDYKGDDRMIHS
ncbi:MAG: hypothetical protein RMM08_07775 [Armatimonadota bacterium]|nr:hypothetical protein [bacterium]MDW8321246.1 hypothetical protein [Armatimonadota bacterium]